MNLGEGEVHIWRVALDSAGDLDVLDPRERERAARFRFESDRRRFIASHTQLRRILARYLNVGPAAVRIEIGKLGKPSVEGPVRFNMSHSGELALYAVALREVGVDVERIRTDLDVMGIASRFLPAPEALELGELEPGERTRAFFRLWTRREAWLKARGIGLGAIGEPVGAGWHIGGLEAGDGYAAAFAVEGTGPTTLRTIK
ncbi:MAG: 4'-phosphopantetheinyl transferase family protein [Acidobacteriota bacterium]